MSDDGPGADRSPDTAPGPAVPADERPLWRRGWFIGLLVLLVAGLVIGLIGVLGGDAADEPAAEPTAPGDPDDDGEGLDDRAVDDPADPREPQTLDERYPDFPALTRSGTGDAVVDLPEGATSGIVIATHDGVEAFSITVLDLDTPAADEPLVAVTGGYEGTTGYGLAPDPDGLDAQPTSVEIRADGDWTVEIAPVMAAPALTVPQVGTGDAVFRYDGPVAEWDIEHTGEADFVVAQHGGLAPNVLVNEIGAFAGPVTIEGIDAPVTIRADGGWSIAAR